MYAIGKKHGNLCPVEVVGYDDGFRFRATSICGKVFTLTYREITSAFNLIAENLEDEVILASERIWN